MNIANNVVTILKKPNGYSYADFLKPKCFLTLDQLNSLGSFEAVCRNSANNEEPVMYYVSKKFLDDASITLGLSMPASTEIEVTDDFLAQSLSKVAEYITGVAEVPQNIGYVVSAGRTNSSYLTAKVINTKSFQYKPHSLPDEVYVPEIRGYMLAADHFAVIAGLLGIPL